MNSSALIPSNNPLPKHSIEDAFAKGNKKISNKRKGGSICIPYYRTRRRIKLESFNPPDLSFFDRCSSYQHHVILNHEAGVGDVMFGECLANIATADLVDKLADECHESTQNDYINGSVREDGFYKHTENVCTLLTDNLMDFFDTGIEPKDDTCMHKGDSDNSSVVTEVEYSSLPDSVLSFSDKDYMVCSLNTEDTIDDIPSSQLLDSPINFLEDSSFDVDDHDDSDCEDDVESTSISYLGPVQLSEGEIICSLNTEDLDIPCIDNSFVLIHQSPVRPQTATDSINPESSFTLSQMDGPDLSSEIDSSHSHVVSTLESVSMDYHCFPDTEDPEIPSPSVRLQSVTDCIDPVSFFTHSQMDGPHLSSQFDSAHSHVGSTLESLSVDNNPSISDHNCDSELPSFHDIEDPETPSPSVRPQTTTDSIEPPSPFTPSRMDGPQLSSEFDSLHSHVGSTLESVSVDHNPSSSDHKNFESDSDLFPDIEALILKLDSEYARESWLTNEDKRRYRTPINRLERSSSQRTMSSLGAFAVLSSRHFNYFIKKTEVTIGRSTDDTEVDIDLRKESHANTISRQQAIVKMEDDGTFILTNIGKGSILVKGKPIDHGQVADLSSGCLIQIKGMNFMFEINDRHMRWHLDYSIQKTEGCNCDSGLPYFPDIEDPETPSPSVRPQTATDSIDPVSSLTQSQMDGSNIASESDSSHSHGGGTFTSVSVGHTPSIADRNCENDLPCFPDTEDLEIPSLSVTPQASMDSIDRLPYFTQSRMDGPHISCEIDSAHSHVGSTLESVSVDHNSSLSDDNDSDSDSDQPHFPDIEALILKLDSDYAQDSWITDEDKRRRYKHSKTPINRLDQSSSQRAMSSLGAFAVLSSQHFNYFIKKTKVTIGRSTDDTEVDIDLRKETHANMISRQQAIVKMEDDGTFILTNIGKGSILVKGKPIDHGQVADLGSGCLIQIKGMSFMFEINDRHVRWYLDNSIQKTESKFRTFEWSMNSV